MNPLTLENATLRISDAKFINQSLRFAQEQGKSLVAYLLPESSKTTFIIGKEEKFNGSLEDQKAGFIISGFSGHTSPQIIIAEYIYTIEGGKLTIISSQDNLFIEKIGSQAADPYLENAPNPTTPSDFQQNATTAIRQIKDGHLKKVVLARQKPIEITNTNPGLIFETLSNGFENSFRSIYLT